MCPRWLALMGLMMASLIQVSVAQQPPAVSAYRRPIAVAWNEQPQSQRNMAEPYAVIVNDTLFVRGPYSADSDHTYLPMAYVVADTVVLRLVCMPRVGTIVLRAARMTSFEATLQDRDALSARSVRLEVLYALNDLVAPEWHVSIQR